MLKIVLLCLLISFAGVALLPEATAWNPCGGGSVTAGTPVLCGTQCEIRPDGGIRCW